MRLAFRDESLSAFDDCQRDPGPDAEAREEPVVAHCGLSKGRLREPRGTAEGLESGENLRSNVHAARTVTEISAIVKNGGGKVRRASPPAAWKSGSRMAPEPKTHLQREIEHFMELLEMSGRELARKSGVNIGAVNDILAGRSKHPRHDTIEKLAGALGATPAQLIGGKSSPGGRLPTPSETVALTELDVYAAAGGGAFVDDERAIAQWQFPASWLRSELRAQPAQVHIVTIEGDSMAPTLMPGDKVIVDLSRRAPSPPGVFIVHDGIALVAKRLEFIEGSEPARVRILSDNDRYKPYERTADEIRVAGRIVARWQRL